MNRVGQVVQRVPESRRILAVDRDRATVVFGTNDSIGARVSHGHWLVRITNSKNLCDRPVGHTDVDVFQKVAICPVEKRGAELKVRKQLTLDTDAELVSEWRSKFRVNVDIASGEELVNKGVLLAELEEVVTVKIGPRVELRAHAVRVQESAPANPLLV